MLSFLLASAASAAGPIAEVPPQMFAPGTISIPVRATAPTFMPDGDVVIYERDTGSTRELVQSRRDAKRWFPPEPLPIDGRFTAIEPSLAPDGSYLLFASNRPPSGTVPLDGSWGGATQPMRGGAIWRMDRISGGWGAPRILSAAVNQGSTTFEPAATISGRIYFMRTDTDGEFHIFYCDPDGGGFRPSKPMPFNQVDVGDIDPAVAADESFIVFGSNRGKGGSDNRLFVTFRTQAGWSSPVLLPGNFNGGAGITEPRLGDHDRTLYYTQNRAIWSVPLTSLLDAVRKVGL